MNYFDKMTDVLLLDVNTTAQEGDKDSLLSATSVLSRHLSLKGDTAYQLALRMTEQAENYDPYSAGVLEWYDFVLITYNELAGDDVNAKLKLYKQVQEWACDLDKRDLPSAEMCRELAQDILEFILEDIEL